MKKKWIGIGIIIAIIAVSVSIWWMQTRWPVGELTVLIDAPGEWVLGKEDTVTLQTNQEYERTKNCSISLGLEVPGFDVHNVRLVNEDNMASFQAELSPVDVMYQNRIPLILQRKNKVIYSNSFLVTVPAPGFTKEEMPSFSEMILAPDASIYGSHITIWNAPEKDGLMTVTGHAASSVCRVASAALFGLARYSNIDSPYFFLGAGLGVLDTSGYSDRLSADINKFGVEYPNLWAEIQKHIESKAEKTRTIMQFYIKLAAIAANKDTDELIANMADNEKELITNIEHDVLANLAEAVSGDWTTAIVAKEDEVAHRSQVLAKLTEKKAADLDESELLSVSEFIARPEATIAALWHAQNADLENCMQIVRGMTKDQRKGMAIHLDALVERIKAYETVSTDLNDLASSSGLVKIKDELTALRAPENVGQVVDSIRSWAKSGETIGSIDLVALSSGYEGCLTLPFFDLKGEPLIFRLPGELFKGGEGDNLRKIMGSLAAEEMSAVLSAAAERLKKVHDEALETLNQLSVFMGNSDKITEISKVSEEWRNRLLKEKSYSIQDVDQNGRVTGTHEKVMSHFRFIVNTWKTASSARRLEMFYRRMAERAVMANKDTVFQRISDRCLIDSLLRGWGLAFSDEKMEKQFETWSKECRTRAWEGIFKQSREQGINPQVLFGEGTAFQVVESGSDLLIKPVFVADIVRTRCVRDTEAGLCRYTSQWQDRKPIHFSSKNRAIGMTPDELGSSIVHRVIEEVKIQALAFPNEDYEKQSRFLTETEAKLNIWQKELETAFCAAPESVATALVNAVLSPWPVKSSVFSENDRRKFKQIRIYNQHLQLGSDLNQQWQAFGDRMESGQWAFVDQYAIFSQAWRSTAAVKDDVTVKSILIARADALEKYGRKLDNGFMDEALQSGEIDHFSDDFMLFQKKFHEFQAWNDERSAFIAMQALLLLGEVEQTLDGTGSDDVIRYRIKTLIKEIEALKISNMDVSVSLSELKHFIKNPLAPVEYAETPLWNLANAIEHMPDKFNNTIWRMAVRCRILEKQVTRTKQSGDVFTKKTVLNIIKDIRLALASQWVELWLQPAATQSIEKLENLSKRVDQAVFDALDRRQFKMEISEISSEIAGITVNYLQSIHGERPTRRTLEFLVQLQWAGGQYQQAINFLTGETRNMLRSNPSIMEDKGMESTLLDTLFSQVKPQLLKACVYSGGEFFGASIFGKRPSDWVSKPEKIEEVVTSLEQRMTGYINENTSHEIEMIYRQVISEKNLPLPETLGDYRVLSARKISGNILKLQVVGPNGLCEFTIAPNDAEGLSRKKAKAALELASKSRRSNLSAPVYLPIHSGEEPRFYQNEKFVIMLEIPVDLTNGSEVIATQTHKNVPDEIYLSTGEWVPKNDVGALLQGIPKKCSLVLPTEMRHRYHKIHEIQTKKNVRISFSDKVSRAKANMQIPTPPFTTNDVELLTGQQVNEIIPDEEGLVVIPFGIGSDLGLDSLLTHWEESMKNFEEDRFAGKQIALVVGGDFDEAAEAQQLNRLHRLREKLLQAGARSVSVPTRILKEAEARNVYDACRRLETDTSFNDINEFVKTAIIKAQEISDTPPVLPGDFWMLPYTWYSPEFEQGIPDADKMYASNFSVR